MRFTSVRHWGWLAAWAMLASVASAQWPDAYYAQPGYSQPVYPTYEDVGVASMDCVSADAFGPLLRLQTTYPDGLGFEDSSYGVSAFLPHHVNPGFDLLFLALEGSVTDNGRGVGNVGLGYRHYSSRFDRVFTYSGWGDVDDRARTWYRAGASIESLGRNWDMRLNTYYVLEDDHERVAEELFGPASFGGNSLLLNNRIVTETAYSGGDIEVGGPIPFVGRYGVSGYVGGYYLRTDHDDSDTVGVRVRAQAMIYEDLQFNVTYTEDDLFGANTWFQFVWTIPDGRPSRWFKPVPVQDRMRAPIERSNRIHILTRDEVFKVPAINPKDGEPFHVVHVDPNRTGGDGTWERPLGDLEDYVNDPRTDIIRVLARNDGTSTGLERTTPLILHDNARLLSAHRQHLFRSTAGEFELPGFRPSPTGLGPMITNIDDVASHVVEVNDHSEISGMIIDGGGLHDLVIGSDLVGFNFNNNVFQNGRNAILLTNATGTVEMGHPGIFHNNIVQDNTEDGFVLNNIKDGTLDLSFLNNQLLRNGPSGSLEDAGPVTGATAPGVGGAGARIATLGVINAQDPLEEDDDNTDDDELQLGFFNNIFIGNGTGMELSAELTGTILATIENNVFDENTDTQTGLSLKADGGTLLVDRVTNNSFSNNLFAGFSAAAINDGTLSIGDFSFNLVVDNGRNGIIAMVDGSKSSLTLPIGRLFDDDGEDILFPSNIITGNGLLEDDDTEVDETKAAILITMANRGTADIDIVNNDLDNNGVGLLVNSGMNPMMVTDSGTLDLLVRNNTFDRNIEGAGTGIVFDTKGVNVIGTIAGNTFIGDLGVSLQNPDDPASPLVPNAPDLGLGIDATLNGGTFDLTIGGDEIADINEFDQNVGAGIALRIQQHATGSFDIVNNLVHRTAIFQPALPTAPVDPMATPPFDPFVGDGIHIRVEGTDALENATAIVSNSRIEGNALGDIFDETLGNEGRGLVVYAGEETTLEDWTITNNFIGNNGTLGADGTIGSFDPDNLPEDQVRFTFVDNAVIRNVVVANNRIDNLIEEITDPTTGMTTVTQFGAGDGIEIVARHGVNAVGTRLQEPPPLNPVTGVVIRNNIIQDMEFNGIQLGVEADALLHVDILMNDIINSGANGILTTENVLDPTDLREIGGNWIGNKITDNGAHGIGLNAALSVDEMVIAANIIERNGFDGIEFNSAGGALIDSNIISFNGVNAALDPMQDGTGIDIQDATFKDIRIVRNSIKENAGDGIEIQHLADGSGSDLGAAPVEVLIQGNTIERNIGRGVDILNQGGLVDTTFNPADTTVRLLDNKIASNLREGVYVVNTSSLTQGQQGPTPVPATPTDSTRGMASDGDNNAVPRLVLELDNNRIIKNGEDVDLDDMGNVIPTLNGTGLVIRVGTSDESGPDFAVDGAGGIIAKVTNNEFDGNFGVDVYIESFRSTPSGGLARLDMIFEENVGDSIDVTNFGAFFGTAPNQLNAQRAPGGAPGFVPIDGVVVGTQTGTVRRRAIPDTVPTQFILDPTPTTFEGSANLDPNAATYQNLEISMVDPNAPASAPEFRTIVSYSGQDPTDPATQPDRVIAVDPTNPFPFTPQNGTPFSIELSGASPLQPLADFVFDADLDLPAGDPLFTTGALNNLFIQFTVTDGNRLDGQVVQIGLHEDNRPGTGTSQNYFANITRAQGSEATFHFPTAAFTLAPRAGDEFVITQRVPGIGPSTFRVQGAFLTDDIGNPISMETNTFTFENLGFNDFVSLGTGPDELPFEWDLLDDDVSGFFAPLDPLPPAPTTVD